MKFCLQGLSDAQSVQTRLKRQVSLVHSMPHPLCVQSVQLGVLL